MDDQPASSSKSSKKPLIIGVIVVLLVAAGVGYYFYNKNQDEKKAKQQAAVQNLQDQQAAAKQQTKDTLNALSNSGQPFVATVKSNAGGKDITGVMTSDGQGNTSYVYQADGKNITLTYTKDAYYLCSEGSQCLKYNLSSSSTSVFDPSAYQYDNTKLDNLKNAAAYKGQQDCPSPATGTCDVWSVTNGGATTTMYVNSSTKRIAKVTSVSGTTSTDVTYEYKNATVAIPTNFTTIPTTGQ